MLRFSILYVNINSSVIHVRGKIAAVISSAIVLVLSSTIQSTVAADITLFTPGSKPYGLTFGEWAAKWHAWLYSIPGPINPASDTTGQNCAQNQNGPAWFLAGTTGGSVDRTCTIPAGKALLLPLVANECSYKENPNLKTEAELRACAVDPNNGVTHLELTIDGVNIQGLEKDRAQSPLFNFTFSNNNLGGVTPGPTQGVADGFWAIVPPLSSGNHTIHFKAIAVQPATTGTSNSFVIDTTYHLRVQ
jgi:hypothetical protein